MTKYQVPNVPFVEAHLRGGKQRPTAITIEISWTTSDEGAALGIANRLHKPSSPAASYHYILDEAKTYRGAWDNQLTCSHPKNALSVLICAQPHEYVTMWEDGTATQVMGRAAALVADLCLAHKIRARYLDEKAERRWMKWRSCRRGGIIVNVEGTWPYEAFMDELTYQMIIRGERSCA